MRAKLTFTLITILGVLIVGCKQKEQKVEVEEVKIDLVNDEFPESKEAIKKTMDSIAQSVKDGDIDRLISFHAYSPKFTEFKNGEPRNGGEENEEFERNIFGSVTEVVKFDMNDMKVAVYGDVANVTLHSDFHLKFGEDLTVVNDQISLLFVNTKNGWRIVHEHHSPLKKEENE
ncbi:MAG: nuclear transport factor 2 family protein [Eudoraea sp.]|nr:nuclear transport factor 2 family protein [Eudoraea sp.]